MGVDLEISSDLCSGRRPLSKSDEYSESTPISWRYITHSHLKNIKNLFHSGTRFCLTLVEHDTLGKHFSLCNHPKNRVLSRGTHLVVLFWTSSYAMSCVYCTCQGRR